jgi:hypothetical protein
MILSARFVRRPRKHYVCDWCERDIVGALIYLYGMAEIGMKPYALRYHVRCVEEHFHPTGKFGAALAAATTSPDDPAARAAPDTTDDEAL